MEYKKSFIIVVSSIILGLLSVAIFNYLVDPANMFKPHEYESGIAEILISNKNVANISNYDERLVQKYLVEKSNQKRDVLIFGSSRSMGISGYLFPQQTFFNHFVSGASIEDHIAIYEMYKERNWMPKKIIIGLDPWLLNKNNQQTRWQSLEEEYNNANTRLRLDNTMRISQYFMKRTYKKYLELISMPYLIAAYDAFNKPKKQVEYYSTTDSELAVGIKMMDGTMSYPEVYRNASIAEVKQKAIAYANADPIYSLGSFEKLDEENILKFERFINDLKKQNIEIIFFLPPYHPEVYNAVINNGKYAMVLQAQSYFINYAQKAGIAIIGSYNPAECGLSDDDFYDGMHPKIHAINKLFN